MFVSVFIKVSFLFVDFFAMSLPPKVVPKQAAVAVSGPGSGPSPSNQLRANLTSVSLPPGAPTAPQPGAVPPPQYPFFLDSGNVGKMLVGFLFFGAFRFPFYASSKHRLVISGR